MNNYGMETKEFKEQKSAIKGISFIKSRKAYINVLGINKDIYNSAKKNGIEITDFFVDDSNSRDYDREELTELISFMENSSAEVLVLRNLYEITDNPDDVREFILLAEKCGIKICCMAAGLVAITIRDDESGC